MHGIRATCLAVLVLASTAASELTLDASCYRVTKRPGRIIEVVPLVIRNADAEAIRLVEVVRSCGCLSVDPEELGLIPAGEAATLHLLVDTSSFIADVRKHAVIRARRADGTIVTASAEIEIGVPDPLAAHPRFLTWAPSSTAHERTVEVVYHGTQKVTGVEAEVAGEFAPSVRVDWPAGSSTARVVVTPTGVDRRGEPTISEAVLTICATLEKGGSESVRVRLFIHDDYVAADPRNSRGSDD